MAAENIERELISLIRTQIANHPRSQQKAIGPSEIGIPCKRRLGYKLAGVEPVNPGDGWLPTVGTATHSWLSYALHAANAHLGRSRYLIEHYISVPCGTGCKIHGSLDCYDTDLDTVVDWKIVGKTTLTEVKRGRISQQYRVQLNTYGLGLHLQGYDVKSIALAAIPRNSVLSDAVVHVEPFDPELAASALAELDDLHKGIDALGLDVIQYLETTSDKDDCRYCPFKRFSSTDLTKACPGLVSAPTDVHTLLGAAK